jgi:hypothetical protein
MAVKLRDKCTHALKGLWATGRQLSMPGVLQIAGWEAELLHDRHLVPSLPVHFPTAYRRRRRHCDISRL